MAIVTPTDNPKLPRNRCVMELLVAFVLSHCFSVYVGVLSQDWVRFLPFSFLQGYTKKSRDRSWVSSLVVMVITFSNMYCTPVFNNFDGYWLSFITLPSVYVFCVFNLASFVLFTKFVIFVARVQHTNRSLLLPMYLAAPQNVRLFRISILLLCQPPWFPNSVQL